MFLFLATISRRNARSTTVGRTVADTATFPMSGSVPRPDEWRTKTSRSAGALALRKQVYSWFERQSRAAEVRGGLSLRSAVRLV